MSHLVGSNSVGDHVLEAHEYHLFPVCWLKFDIGQHNVHGCENDWESVEGGHVDSHVKIETMPREVWKDLRSQNNPKERSDH